MTLPIENKKMRLFILLVISLWLSDASIASHHMMVSPLTYKHLQKVEALIEQGQLAQAQTYTAKLLKRKSLNPYEKSIIQQMSAGISIRNENYRQAIETFKVILTLNALPEKNLLNIHYTLAQLFMQNDEHQNALKYLKIWLAGTKNPKPESWQFLASIYIAQKNYAQAIPAARKALALAKPKNESHYQLLLSLYQRINENQLAILLLEEMIGRFPQNKEYWMQLFFMLSKEGQEESALTILDLAYSNKLLTDKNELLQLAQLHLYHDSPLRAALILEAAIKANKVQEEPSILQLLASAWFNAREYEKFIKILKKLAILSNDGKTYYQLAQGYRKLGLWEEVIASLQMALKDKDLDNKGACYLLMGLAYSELGKHTEAKKAFEKSLQDARTEDEAKKWLDYLSPFIDQSL